MAQVTGAKHVKSAKRVLEVFEYFKGGRRSASVMEIARRYGYPQSSTSELLTCLVELGFLQRDAGGRTYRPTARVAMLGAWVHPDLFRSGSVLPMIDGLLNRVERPVVLASALGFSIQCLDMVSPDGDECDHADWEEFGSLFQSSIGTALLSACDRRHVTRMIHRHNAEARPEWRVRTEDVLGSIDRVRDRGYAIGHLAADTTTVAAVLLPHDDTREQLALGILLRPEDADNEEFFVQALRGVVASHVGPLLVHNTAAPRQQPPQAFVGSANAMSASGFSRTGSITL